MNKDYTPNLETVKRLINKFGREIILRKLDGFSQYPDEPWLGAADPVSSADTISLYGVAVPPSSLAKLGFDATTNDFIKDLKEILIVEPGENDPENIELYNTVLDGTSEYKIMFIEKLRPATLTLLYFIGLAR